MAACKKCAFARVGPEPAVCHMAGKPCVVRYGTEEVPAIFKHWCNGSAVVEIQSRSDLLVVDKVRYNKIRFLEGE